MAGIIAEDTAGITVGIIVVATVGATGRDIGLCAEGIGIIIVAGIMQIRGGVTGRLHADIAAARIRNGA